jgi:hypothetical protein
LLYNILSGQTFQNLNFFLKANKTIQNDYDENCFIALRKNSKDFHWDNSSGMMEIKLSVEDNCKNQFCNAKLKMKTAY